MFQWTEQRSNRTKFQWIERLSSIMDCMWSPRVPRGDRCAAWFPPALIYSPVWMLLFTLLCECSCLLSCVNALVYSPVWMLLFTLLCECSCLLSCVNALIYSPVWMLWGLLAWALFPFRVSFTPLCLHFQACLLWHCFRSGSRLLFCVYTFKLACLGTAFNQGLVSFFVFTISSLLA